MQRMLGQTDPAARGISLLLRLLGHTDAGARGTAAKLLGLLIPALPFAQVGMPALALTLPWRAAAACGKRAGALGSCWESFGP